MSGLAEVLQELAELLPERLRVERSYWMIWQGDRKHLNLLDEDMPSCLLEYALREECEARGWYYSQHCVSVDGQGSGRWYVAEIGPHSGEADTPAHALALALLAALQALAPAQAGQGVDGE